MYQSHHRKGQKKAIEELLTFAADDPKFCSDARAFFGNEVLALASRLVRLRAKSFALFNEVFDGTIAEFSKELPKAPEYTGYFMTRLAVLEKDGSVTVFSNITMDVPIATTAYQYTFPETSGMLLFSDGLYTEAVDPAKEQQWNPLSRAWKRLKRNNNISLTKFLRDFTNIPKSVPDHIILAISEKIVSNTKPMEVLFTKSPEDYADMYMSGGPSSCMVATSQHAGHWKSWMTKESKIVPPSFYHYFPYTKGAYIKRNGQVQARGILFRVDTTVNKDNEKVQKWYYCRIYAVNDGAHRIFTQALESQGIFPIPGGDPWQHWVKHKMVPCDFEIPAYTHGDFKYWPYPHLDHGRPDGAGIHAEYIKAENKFHIYYGNSTKTPNVPLPSTMGYQDHNVVIPCKYCGNVVKSGTGYANGASVFCSESCVRNTGLVIAFTGEGVPTVMHPRDAFKTIGGANYTNREAAIKAANLPAATPGFYYENPFALSSTTSSCSLTDSKNMRITSTPYTYALSALNNMRLEMKAQVFARHPTVMPDISADFIDIKIQRNASIDNKPAQRIVISGNMERIEAARAEVKAYLGRFKLSASVRAALSQGPVPDGLRVDWAA